MAEYFVIRRKYPKCCPMFESTPNRPVQRPSLLNPDPRIIVQNHSVPAKMDDPCSFVGWAYQSLYTPSTSKNTTLRLHNVLTLRTFIAPDETPTPMALWQRLFNAKKHSLAKGRRPSRKLKAVRND